MDDLCRYASRPTLFALLQRFYDVQSGRILIGGQDIARVTQESLRNAISVVPQDICLLHRSVLDNIRYGRPEATEAEVRAAATAARCDFIDALPDGFSTIVGDRGVKLSGGQRQRIAIARAFLKDAWILLLDEATSGLDVHSEELIRATLDELMQGRTVIAIAHRLTTLRSFDRIVELRDGRIVHDGSLEAAPASRQWRRAQIGHETRPQLPSGLRTRRGLHRQGSAQDTRPCDLSARKPREMSQSKAQR